MSEIVERVARALFRASNEFFDENDPAWAVAEAEDKDYWLVKARAAITAMREPTPQMVEEGSIYCCAGCAKGSWKDMISEALK